MKKTMVFITALLLALFLISSYAEIPSTLGWYEIPNTHMMDVCPPNNFAGSGYNFYNSCWAITEAWSSGVFDTKRNRLIIWGGGHNDYYGNEIYALDLNASPIAMLRLTDPGLPTNFGGSTCAEAIANGTQPNSRHTYDGLVYVQHLDKMFVHGGGPACAAGGFTEGTWAFDFATLTWQRLYPSGPIPGGLVATAYDPNTGKVFLIDVYLYSYTFSTNSYQRLSEWNGIDYHMTAVIDPVRKKFVVIGGGQAWIHDISGSGSYNAQALSTTGGSAIINSPYPGLAYDSVTDRIVAWNGGNTVYSLNLDTRVWTSITYSGGPGAALGNGTYKRWSYSPASGVFVVYNAVDNNAWTLRLSAGSADTQAPLVSITSPTNGSTISGSSVTISATASDNVGVVGVQFKLNGANLGSEDTTAPYSITWNTTQTTNDSHTLTATARDAAGNQTTSAGTTVLVNNVASDAQAPTTPTNLSATAVSSSQINLSWTASADNVGVTGYRLERCQGATCTTFTQISTPAVTSYNDIGLSANITYRYRVRANDAAGNLSGYSTFASATTQAQSTGTALAQLANSMSPGEWKQLNTNGFDDGKFLEPCLNTSNVLEYADSATWDPISRQFLFLGTTHGTCLTSKFTIYRDSDNAWRQEPLPNDSAIQGPFHAYDHNTINPATGDFYYRHANSNRVWKYNTNGTRQWSLLTDQLPDALECCGGLEYFPEMTSLVWISGRSRGVWLFNEITRQWTTLAEGLAMGGYHNIIEYNPVHKVIIFGGGNYNGIYGGQRDLYKLEASGKITKLKSPPFDLGISYGPIISVDPVSGKYLAFHLDGKIYEYDIVTDTWGPLGITHPLVGSYGVFNAVEASISSYGVMMFVTYSPAAVWIYKHSSGTNPPLTDTTPPTVSVTAPTSGSTVSGSSVTIFATASDNVGVVGVQFKLDGANLGSEDTTIPYSITWNTAQTSNGSHTLTATARDAAGNQTTSSGITVTVSNASDTQAPTTPTNLSATAISSSQINLSWTASTDNVGVTGYRVERCQGSTCTTFAQISTPAGISYSDTGLSANSTYRYRVRAADAAGNLSGYSSIATATTQASPGGPLNIPVNTWVSRSIPAFPSALGTEHGNKHVRLVYDTDRRLIYLWGGDYCVNIPGYGDRCASHEYLWSYDLARDKWEMLIDEANPVSGYPRGRCLPSFTYDSKRKVVWMTSGQQRYAQYNSKLYSGYGLFAFDPATRTWSHEGPSPDYGESVNVAQCCPDIRNDRAEWMAYDPVNDSLFVPSRANIEYDLSNVVLKDGVIQDNWRRSPLSVDSGSFGSIQFAVDTKRNRAIIYKPEKGETWSYNFATKQTTLLSSQVLPMMDEFGMHYNTKNDTVVIYGGYDYWEGTSTANFLNELWVFDFTTNRWSKPVLGGNPPLPYHGDQSVYDSYNDVFIVLSGGTGSGWATMHLLRLSLGATPLKGDVNKDSAVDVLDIQALVNHILGIQDYGSGTDVNSDGSVDVLDVQEVVNVILGTG